jgi:hypothetical protein
MAGGGGAWNGFTVMVAVAVLVGSATLVAITVVVSVVLTVGAVHTKEVPVPEVGLPLAAFQVTAVLIVPVTCAVNC